MNYEVYTLVALFTVIDCKLKIASDNNGLIKYKFNSESSLDSYIYDYLNSRIEINNNALKQAHTYFDKNCINILYVGLVNNNTKIKDKSIEWKEINYNDYLMNESVKYIKEEINIIDNLKILYSEFTLPDIQKLFENILEIKYDRRNFRKKLINQDIIEDLNKINNTNFGRPAKVYKFKDDLSDNKLF